VTFLSRKTNTRVRLKRGTALPPSSQKGFQSVRLSHSGFKPLTPIQPVYFPHKNPTAICSTSPWHDHVNALDQDGKSVSASAIPVTVIRCRFQSPATCLVRRNGQTDLVARLVRSCPGEMSQLQHLPMDTLGGKDWADSTPTITDSISSDAAMTPGPPVALTRSVVELTPRKLTALDKRVLSVANWWTDENSTQTKTCV